MISTRNVRAWATLWCAFSGVGSAAAETIEGVVADATRQNVAGAIVKALDVDKRAVSRSVTDRSGSFALEFERPGFLQVDANGFERKTVEIGSDHPTRIEIVLEIANFSSEIVVSSALPEMLSEERLDGSRIRSDPEVDLVATLDRLPGVSAIRRGSVNLDPVVRGLSEAQVAAFVDGTRTAAAGPARMDSGLSHIHPMATRQVSVVKGPYALSWGAGALSAIEVSTAALTYSPETLLADGRFATSYGENGNSSESWIEGRFARGKWSSFFGAGHRTGSDYVAGDGSVVPASYESESVRWRVGRRSGNLRIDYSGGYQQQFDIDYPGRLLDATYFYTRSHRLGFSWDSEHAGRLDRIEGQVYSNRKDHLMNNDGKPTAEPHAGRTPPFGLDVALPTEANTLGGRLRFDFTGGWTGGIDFVSVEQTATRSVSRRSNNFVIFEDTVWPDARSRDLGSFVQWIGKLRSTQLGATFRVDSAESSADSPSDFLRMNTNGSLEARDTLLSAAVNASWDLGHAGRLTIGIGHVERAPTTLERYSDRFPSTRFQIAAEFLGSPTLEPEASLEFDLGLAVSTERTSVHLDTFVRSLENYITVVPEPGIARRLPLSPPTVYRYVNGDSALFVGLEGRVTHRMGQRTTLQFAFEWLRGTDRQLDEPVFGIAPLSVDLGIVSRHFQDRLEIEGNLHVAGDQDRVATSRLEQPTDGYATLSVAGRWRFTDRFVFRAGVDNLTDQTYSWHLATLDPFTGERVLERGRNLFAGLEIAF